MFLAKSELILRVELPQRGNSSSETKIVYCTILLFIITIIIIIVIISFLLKFKLNFCQSLVSFVYKNVVKKQMTILFTKN